MFNSNVESVVNKAVDRYASTASIHAASTPSFDVGELVTRITAAFEGREEQKIDLSGLGNVVAAAVSRALEERQPSSEMTVLETALSTSESRNRCYTLI